MTRLSIPYCIVLFFLSALLYGQKKNEVGNFFEKALESIESAPDSFFFYFDNGRAAFVKEGVYNDYFDEVLSLAQSIYQSRNYQEGVSILKTLEEDASSLFLIQEEQRINLNYQLARGFYYLRDVDNCVKYVKANLPKLDSTGIEYGNHHNILGLIYYWNGDFLDALPSMLKVYHIRKGVFGREDNRVATILNNLGNVYEDLKLLNKARDCYLEGLEIRETVLGKNDPRLYSLMNNLAYVLNQKGDYFQSINIYKEAIALLEAEKENNWTELAVVYQNLAISLKNIGAFEEASLYYDKTEEALKNTQDEASIIQLGDLYVNRANLALYDSDFKKAIELNQRGIETYGQVLDSLHLKILAAWNNIGFIYASQGENDKALKTLIQLKKLMEGNADRQIQLANVCNDIAGIYLKKEALEQAKTNAQMALSVQQSYFEDENYRLAYSYNQLAEIAFRQDDHKAGAQYLSLALKANKAENMPLEGFSNYKYYLQTLLLKAEAAEPGEALAVYSRADEVLSAIKNELRSVDDQIQLSDYAYKISSKAIHAALEMDNKETAFFFSERMKANVLSQLLTLKQGRNFVGIPEDSLRLEEQLLSDIGFFKLQLADEPEGENRSLFQNELFNAQKDYRDLIGDFEQRYPDYYALKYGKNELTVKEVQSVLPETTAMLSYVTSDQYLYAFVITAKAFDVHQIRKPDDFDDLLTGLRKTIHLRLDQDYLELGYELYQILFPFSLPDDIRSLVFVPDGGLSQIPFEALLQSKTNIKANIQFSDLPYLVNNFNISYAPSAGIFVQQLEKADIAYDQGLLAYAPVFDDPQNLEGYDEVARASFDQNTEIQRVVSLDGKTVAALPATLNEIQSVEKVFGENGRGASTFLYRDATESRLKASLDQSYRFIHIATHGFINEKQTDLSGLLFYPDTTSAEDHVLFSGEVYSLPFQTDLLVLSACETGLGQTVRGEGLLGLSRAFLYAGADNLLVSLWKVQDQATSDLMVDFYKKYWQEVNHPYSKPLREAKMNMIQSERFSHPYYWSSFILIGE